MRKKIKDLIKELKSIQIAEAQLEKLKTKRHAYAMRMREIEGSIDYDSEVLDKLSSNNLFSMYHLLLRRKDSTLDLVKRHYLQLSIEYNDLNKSIKIIDFEQEVLLRKIAQEAGIKESLQLLFDEVESELKGPDLKQYRSILNRQNSKIRLAKEIREAVAAGQKIEARFDEAKACLEKFQDTLEEKNYSAKRISTHKVRNIEDYQEIMVKINHDFLMYEVEVNDVYNEILNAKDYQSSIVSSFMKDYRRNLAEDIGNARSLKSSGQFIKRYKEIIAGLDEVLSRDLKKIEEEIRIIDEEGEEFLEQLSLS